MKFLVLGAGAIGGYFGGRLVESGADVTFLVRPDRRAQLEREGLRIESALGNMSRPVRTALADSVASDYDVVLLTCKAYDLQSSIEAIAPAVGPQTAVVPLLNGLAHFAVLDRHFGASRVMGGTCMIDSILGRDGVVHHGGTLQRLVFGERDNNALRGLRPSRPFWPARPSTGHCPMTSSRCCGRSWSFSLRWPR